MNRRSSLAMLLVLLIAIAGPTQAQEGHEPHAVVTPEPLVGGVSWRVECENALKLEALAGSPANSLSSLRFNLLRSPAAGTEAKTG